MSGYMSELYTFFEELSENNDRAWFAANRSRYDMLRESWLADLDRMIGAMSAWDPALRTQTARGCAYRIYRDTRFSQDKTPFKLFFSAAISPWGRKSCRAGYYLHMGLPGLMDSGLYGGIWQPDAAMLSKLRHAMVDNIEEFTEIITNPDLVKEFPGWCGQMLRTAPKGWDRNHPCIELLRLKDIGKFHRCDRSFFMHEDWPERAAELFRLLKPLNDFLNYSLDE